MEYSLSIQEQHYDALIAHLFRDREVERAAYLLCSLSSTDLEKRLLVQDVIRVADDEIERESATDIVIRQVSFLRALKRAARNNLCFVFVHSHPEGFLDHSSQDDREESTLFRTAYIRIHREDAIHASLVISNRELPRGRVWLRDSTNQPIKRVRIIGNKFAFYDRADKGGHNTKIFDRQVLAFGKDVQNLFRKLHVGIVGFGGTGSAVFEQLVRVGIGKITVCDPQTFDPTNVNRVYGSTSNDTGQKKVAIATRLANAIAIPTEIVPLSGSVTDLAIAQRLRDCDVIFGCTDDESGRSILTRLAAYYLIPVFDMGVMIDSEDQSIKSVRGRVTTLVPGVPCLFCRGTISADGIVAEYLHSANEEEYHQRRMAGYVPELPGTAPSVIMYTSSVASTAICEMLHRFTGYMGKDRRSSEVILRFDESKISTTSRAADPTCWCSLPTSWGAGDSDPFLDLVWRNE
jgi:molybdopterin/thiamine biosynthesis adenylyltransferase